jgi:hypothetical protein
VPDAVQPLLLYTEQCNHRNEKKRLSGTEAFSRILQLKPVCAQYVITVLISVLIITSAMTIISIQCTLFNVSIKL